MAKGSTFELNFCWPARLIQTFFKNLKYVERNGILIIDADIPRFIKRRRLYYIEFFVVLARLVNCVNYYKELIGYNRECEHQIIIQEGKINDCPLSGPAFIYSLLQR